LCVATILNPNLDISGVLPEDLSYYQELAINYLSEKTQHDQIYQTKFEKHTKRGSRVFSKQQDELMPYFESWDHEVSDVV
jgi:hypothetical protein